VYTAAYPMFIQNQKNNRAFLKIDTTAAKSFNIC